MHGDIHILSRSPVATVYDFRCDACPESVYNDAFDRPDLEEGLRITPRMLQRRTVRLKFTYLFDL